MFSAPVIEQLARERARDAARRSADAARLSPPFPVRGVRAGQGKPLPRRLLRALARPVGRLLVSAGARLGGLPEAVPAASPPGGGKLIPLGVRLPEYDRLTGGWEALWNSKERCSKRL